MCLLPKKLWQSLIGSAKKISNKTSRIEKIALVFIVLYYLFYTYIPEREPFYSIFSYTNIERLSICLLQSPQKISDSYYILEARVLEQGFENRLGKFRQTGGGKLSCLVPSSLIESLYPGRLFSTAAQNDSLTIFETGAIIECFGSFTKAKEGYLKPSFFIEKAIQKGWKSKLSKTRALLRLAFKRLIYSWGEGGALILALLSGERVYLPKNLSDAFRNAGLSHVLALSGMHLSFFAGLTAGFAKKLFGKKYTPLFSFLAISFFVWFAGFSPSLLRAYICAIIGLASAYISLEIDLTSVLSLSFITQILLSPADGMSLSFLLSYSALLGIALFSSFFITKLIRFVPEKLALSLAASISAQIFTMPFTLIFFGTITPIGIIATVFISPLISLFMSLGICAILMSLIFPQTLFLSGLLIKGLYSLIAFLVLWFARVPAIQF